MFCPSCGKPNSDVDFCVKCGSAMIPAPVATAERPPAPPVYHPEQEQASDHPRYFAMWMLTFFIPLAGLIAGLVYLLAEDDLSRKLGRYLVIFAVLLLAIGFVLYFFLFPFIL